ncbi:hypothetical protein IPM19_02985 [bacterium]|nr:MAG: hypothetical protein IPM19_02985 [bacterium]
MANENEFDMETTEAGGNMFADLFDETRDNVIEVSCDGNVINIPESDAVGKSIFFIRDQYGASLSLGKHHKAFVSGEQIGDNYTIQAGDRIAFESTGLAEATGATAVQVVSGAHQKSLNVSGMTIRALRGKLGDALSISPAAKAYVNGQEVNNDYVVYGGDSVEFAKDAGEKGD